MLLFDLALDHGLITMVQWMVVGASIPVTVREVSQPFAAVSSPVPVVLSQVILADVSNEPRWDAAGSLAIGVLLVVIAIVLAVEMASLLVGEAAAPDVVTRIRGVLEGHPCVNRLIALRTQHVGPDDIIINAKVEFDPR